LFFPQELQKTDGHTILWICQWLTQNQQCFSGGTILCSTIRNDISQCVSHTHTQSPDFLTNETAKGIWTDVFHLSQQVLMQCFHVHGIAVEALWICLQWGGRYVIRKRYTIYGCLDYRLEHLQISILEALTSLELRLGLKRVRKTFMAF
jgi:hypothetical protein